MPQYEVIAVATSGGEPLYPTVNSQEEAEAEKERREKLYPALQFEIREK